MVISSDTSKWYVVHCHSGFEKKIADAILDEAKKVDLDDLIEEVSVPTQAVVEVRRGVRVNSEKKFFPGYVLVKMVMPGDNITLEVELLAPIAMSNNLRFAIREGGRTVGSGVVSEILD